MFNLEYIRRAESFFALQVPVYYYVKTKGSLCTQGLSISKTIQMKLTAFEYYDQFYKSVLDEEEYEKSRLKIYRFLIDAAEDGVVPPAAARLGSERVLASQNALRGRGLLFDLYRDRKLLDYCLEPVAQKNGLSLPEARLLLYLRQSGGGARRELADFADLSRGALSMLLGRLSAKGLLSVTEAREEGGEKNLEITFLPAAEMVMAHLEEVWRDVSSIRLNGLSPAEREEYEALSAKVQESIRNVLQ